MPVRWSQHIRRRQVELQGRLLVHLPIQTKRWKMSLFQLVKWNQATSAFINFSLQVKFKFWVRKCILIFIQYVFYIEVVVTIALPRLLYENISFPFYYIYVHLKLRRNYEEFIFKMNENHVLTFSKFLKMISICFQKLQKKITSKMHFLNVH